MIFGGWYRRKHSTEKTTSPAPRPAGSANIRVEGLANADFTAKQQLANGVTVCAFALDGGKLVFKSWVSAVDNLAFVEIAAVGQMRRISVSLNAPHNQQARWRDILDKLSAFPNQERNGRRVFRYTEKGVDWWENNGLGIQHICPANAITLDSGDELLTLSRNTISDMKRFQDANTSSSFFMAAD